MVGLIANIALGVGFASVFLCISACCFGFIALSWSSSEMEVRFLRIFGLLMGTSGLCGVCACIANCIFMFNGWE